jgi:hypothetical protein
MTCPSCSQQPISYWKYNISISRGVGISGALKGYLKCQNCHSLLHAGTLGRTFWSVLLTLVILIILLGVFFRPISSSIGNTSAAILFCVLVLATVFISNYLGWKHVHYEKVDVMTDLPPKT